MSDKTIWKALIDAGLTEAGAAGLMGNLYAESGLIANRVEILCLKRLKEAGKIYTDATYTAFVDDGTITREQFLHPLPGKQYGYGLAQWTSPGRKGSLYDFIKSKKVSIGDEKAQVEFLVKELSESYAAVLKTLKTTSNIKTASNAVLKKFEMPADTGTAVQELRYQYSRKYYDLYAGSGEKTAEKAAVKAVTAEDALALLRTWIGKNEYDESHRGIIDIYNSYKPLARGYRVQYTDSWCDATMSALFIKLGAVDLIGGTECGVQEHVSLFMKAGIWKGRIMPEPGDLIIYDWQRDGYADHIGMVEKVTGTTVTTIEGNYSDSVKRRTLAYNRSDIMGYARPKYGAVEEKLTESQTAAAAGKLSESPKWVGRVTASTLNVRSWAGTAYPNIKSWPYLKQGNLIDVCDTVKASDGASWYYVRIAGKYFGFVSAKYIIKA